MAVLHSALIQYANFPMPSECHANFFAAREPPAPNHQKYNHLELLEPFVCVCVCTYVPRHNYSHRLVCHCSCITYIYICMYMHIGFRLLEYPLKLRRTSACNWSQSWRRESSPLAWWPRRFVDPRLINAGFLIQDGPLMFWGSQKKAKGPRRMGSWKRGTHAGSPTSGHSPKSHADADLRSLKALIRHRGKPVAFAGRFSLVSATRNSVANILYGHPCKSSHALSLSSSVCLSRSLCLSLLPRSLRRPVLPLLPLLVHE